MKFHIYAHEEHEEADWYAEEIANELGDETVKTAIQEFLETHPLYEVEFDIDYDPSTNKFTFVGCRSTQGRSWELKA